MSYTGPDGDGQHGLVEPISLRRTTYYQKQRPASWMYGDADMSLRTFVRSAVKRAKVAGYQTDIRSVHALDRHLTRLGYQCHWCGGPFEQIDHVMPLSRGGLDKMSNIVPSCATCNSEKGEMDPEEWRQIVDSRKAAEGGISA